MDRISRERRSWLMSQVGSKNTKPELFVRKYIFSKGYRYRLNVSGLPGKPDIVLPKHRKVILVNGCFWHGHARCKYAKLPKTRLAFWRGKIERNRERDTENRKLLKQAGWKVMIVWQCQLRNPDRIKAKIDEFLQEI